MNVYLKAGLAVIGLISVLSLEGCATAGSGTLPSGGAMTMSDIYAQQTGVNAFGNQSLNAVRARLASQARTYPSAQSRQYNGWGTPIPYKARQNPEVPFYVYPHLVHNQAGTQPVPGYTSAFFLYKHNDFASPNEQY